MKALTEAGFRELELHELLSLCGTMLSANHQLGFDGMAACPFWGIVPFVMRTLHGDDPSWMANSYGYARCFISPCASFAACVYEDGDAVGMTFVLPLVSSLDRFSQALAQHFATLSPLLDLNHDLAGRVAALSKTSSCTRFLTRDYYYGTANLASLAEGHVKRSTVLKESNPQLAERLKHGWGDKTMSTIRAYLKTRGFTLHVLGRDLAEFEEISKMMREWRQPYLDRSEMMILVDEYEHAYHPSVLDALNTAGIKWSGHYLRDSNGQMVAASVGMATSTHDWCCLSRVDRPGYSHAAEVPWLMDAVVFHDKGYQRCFDGGGSEMLGRTGLSKFKERYVRWTQGGARMMYTLCTQEQSSRFDINQVMLEKHDLDMTADGFVPSER